MAIGKYSAVPPPADAPPVTAAPPQSHAHAHAHTPSGNLDIEAWTVSALESLSVSGGGPPLLSIPLDSSSSHNDESNNNPSVARKVAIAVDAATVTPPRRPPSRRDSMRRREALLKGKEGSRQRRRWDMARLSDVPNVQPPLASDWQPRPVHPIRHIPYHVAQYWDRGLRQQVEDKDKKRSSGKGVVVVGRVPRDLRDTVKRTPGVVGWVRSLEEPVRQFLVDRGATEAGDGESDYSDDEVVFVGRKGVAAAAAGGAAAGVGDEGWEKVRERQVDRGMVFDSMGDDESGAFKRWLTHSISDYYGLDSRSVTMGTPARRCVYIGIREVDLRKNPGQAPSDLPRPLWEHF